MNVKLIVLVCLIPVVAGHPAEMMEMMKKMMGDHMDHEAGDGDCKTQEEADRKKFEMFQHMMEQEEMMKKKKEADEMKEKYMKFQEQMQKMKMEKEMEEKMKMYKKMEEEKMKHEEDDKEKKFNELIDSFTKKKHHFVFSLTHHFLTMCKCGEIDLQMSKMFMGHNMQNNSNMATDMSHEAAMAAFVSGDWAALANMVRHMSPEEQKELYMSSLIASMCMGAKTFINNAKQFEETYMPGMHGSSTMRPPANSPTPRPNP